MGNHKTITIMNVAITHKVSLCSSVSLQSFLMPCSWAKKQGEMVHIETCPTSTISNVTLRFEVGAKKWTALNDHCKTMPITCIYK